MATHRIIVTQVETPASVEALANPAPGIKVLEQCFENLDLSALVLAVNKRPRVRKQREAKPKA